MKTIVYIFSAILWLGLSYTLQAQEVENPREELVDEDWYLTKLIIDGEEMSFVSSDFLDQIVMYVEVYENNNYVSIDACDWGLSDLYFTGENRFEISGFIFLADDEDGCNEELWNYHFLLFDNFWMKKDYEFFIFQMENYQQLVIENSNGDEAHFQNIPYLSVDKNEISSLNIYPNPVQESFQIENLTEKSHLKIYDLTGKEILQQEIHSSAENIDVSQLSSGLYFYGIFQDGKQVKTGKLIKE